MSWKRTTASRDRARDCSGIMENCCIKGWEKGLVNDLAHERDREWYKFNVKPRLEACTILLSPSDPSLPPTLYVILGCSFFSAHRYYEVVEKLLYSLYLCLFSSLWKFCTTWKVLPLDVERGILRYHCEWNLLCAFNAVLWWWTILCCIRAIIRGRSTTRQSLSC